jgi:hypothetical protein
MEKPAFSPMASVFDEAESGLEPGLMNFARLRLAARRAGGRLA